MEQTFYIVKAPNIQTQAMEFNPGIGITKVREDKVDDEIWKKDLERKAKKFGGKVVKVRLVEF